MEDYSILKTKIYTVSELNQEIKRNLESGYPDIWVEGEVSNFYFHDKKHMYFDLKDENSKIKVVMFQHVNRNLIFNIEEGLHILINGYISLYEKRGEYQVVAMDARPVGKGALILAFEQLKEKLEKKGYFDISHKKNIPLLPGRIGLVTSIGGAVIRDIFLVLKERFENFHVIVRDVNVQGITSSDEICRAIDELCEYGVDVIIIARGGGSLEDLWAFNTEKIAEKIFECPVPIISAIGHETDYTISDFVADRRAATPSVAAEIVILDKKETVEKLKGMFKRATNLIESRVRMLKKEIFFLIRRRTFTRPKTILDRFNQFISEMKIRLERDIGVHVQAKGNRLANLARLIDKKSIIEKVYSYKIEVKNLKVRLFSDAGHYINLKKSEVKYILGKLADRNPVNILERGFALLYDMEEKESIKSVREVRMDQVVRILLRDGMLSAKIFDKIYKKLEPGFKNEN
jgi:exodeoxyribonuclease VII large subunit